MKFLDHRILLTILVAATLLTGTAFVDMYRTTSQWQQRNDVSADVTAIELVENRSTVAVTVVVDNELHRDVEIIRWVVGVYPGEPPYADDSELNHPHSTMSQVTTIEARTEAEMTITTPVRDGYSSELSSRIRNDTVSVSGSIMIKLRDRRYSIDV